MNKISVANNCSSLVTVGTTTNVGAGEKTEADDTKSGFEKLVALAGKKPTGKKPHDIKSLVSETMNLRSSLGKLELTHGETPKTEDKPIEDDAKESILDISQPNLTNSLNQIPYHIFDNIQNMANTTNLVVESETKIDTDIQEPDTEISLANAPSLDVSQLGNSVDTVDVGPTEKGQVVRAKNYVGFPVNNSAFVAAGKLADASALQKDEIVKTKIEVQKIGNQFDFSSTFSKSIGSDIVQNLPGKIADSIAPYASPAFDVRPGLTKSLLIQLHPESLGAIRVAMSLRGQELELKIETNLRETAVALTRDRNLLKDIATSAGYELGDKSVVISFKPEQQIVTPFDNNGQLSSDSYAGQNQFSGTHFSGDRDDSRDMRREKFNGASKSNSALSVETRTTLNGDESRNSNMFV
jgi:flagellar hook-length control protein FliK